VKLNVPVSHVANVAIINKRKLKDIAMKVYVNIGEMWIAVACGKGDGKVSTLIEDVIQRSKDMEVKLQDEEVCR